MLKRIMLVLTVALVMTAMLVATTGAALAAPGKNGKGAENANSSASTGISNAVVKSGSCGIACGG